MRIITMVALGVLAACVERTAAPRLATEASSPAYQRVSQPEEPFVQPSGTRRLAPSAKELELIEEAVTGLPAAAATSLREALLDRTGNSRVISSGSPDHLAAIARVYEEQRRSNPHPTRRAHLPVTIALVPALVSDEAAADIIRRPANSDDQDTILLRESDLTEGRLAGAVFALLRDREVNGLASRNYRHFVVRSATSPAPIPARVFDASATLRQLLTASARPVEGAGTVRAIVVDLPAVRFQQQ